MDRLRTVVTAFVIAAVLAAGAFVAGSRSTREPSGFDVVVDTARELRDRSALDVSEEELARAAIRGMLEVLEDPYAAYLSPRQQDAVDDLLGNSIVGIGVWLERVEDGLRITSLVEGTPAARSGLRTGDVLVEADGHPLGGLSLEEAAGFLRGPEGTTVELVASRGGERLSVAVERTRIDASDVQARMLDAGAAYVRLLRFGRGAADELRATIGALIDDGANGVVLDLRGNAGGLAEEAFGVAGLFLEDGIVARIREPGRPEREITAKGDALPTFPLVTLVDGGTASASEVVAAALQDRDRATIVGTPTYGKGSVLTVSELGGDTSIQYTTAFLLSPDGHAIEGRGVEPDVVVLPGESGDPQLRRAVAELDTAG